MKVKGKYVKTIKNVLGTCPECDGVLIVKQKCSGMVSGDYITVIKCTKCSYTDLSEKTIEEWLKGE